MSHCDEDTLSLLALGEESTTADAAHLAGCTECQAELEALRSVVATARTELSAVLVRAGDGRDATDGLPVALVAPPASVWERIAAATGVTTQARPEAIADVVAAKNGTTHPAGVPAAPAGHGLNGSASALPIAASAKLVAPESVPATPAGSGPVAGDGPATGADPVSSGTPGAAETSGDREGAGSEPVRVPAQRRSAARSGRRDISTMAGIAAVALIMGVLGGFGISNWVQDRNGSSASSPAVVADSALQGLPLAPAAAGEATVVKTASGWRLDVDVRRLEPTTGFYEVWLINSDVSHMVSVGVLQGSAGEFALPEGIDLSQYPLVDVSIQNYQDKGAHSGKSVLRGELRA